MQSAAVIAQQRKEQAKDEGSPGGEPHTITTDGASIREDDKIYLHGNPLRTTPTVICPTCRLPRLTHPRTGRNSQTPDPSRQYCQKEPYVDKDGCDIYGKSLALEKPSKKSKAAKEKDAKKASPDDGSESPTDTTGKNSDKPTSIPSGKCPNCPRYMAFTRIAQHMDRCMGISGRASSKNAMSKMNSSTPQPNSRAGTPKPSSQGTVNNGAKKRKLEKGSDDEDEGEKKKKKVQGKAKAVNANLARVKSAEKRLPGAPEKEQAVKDEDSDAG